jgi:perosamine synthetase
MQSETLVRRGVNTGAVVKAIAAVVGNSPRPVPLHEPQFTGNEWAYVKRCLDDGWVSSAGPFVEQFEQALAVRCGTQAAVATVNGTAALHLALHLVDVRPNDEVIVPTLTFVATANAVTYCGAVPHFVDSEIQSLGIDAAALERYLRRTVDIKNGCAVNRQTQRLIRACIAVHVFGHPGNMEALTRICRDLNIALIEDATEALGSRYQGRPCGGLARIGVISFNGNKVVTTGGGGAIVTNDKNLAARAKHLSTTAKISHPWRFQHDETGWNYRLPNINAALGLAQLEQLDRFLVAKRRVAALYALAFEDISGVRFVVEPANAMSNYWLNAILFDDDSGATRDAVLKANHTAGLLTRPAWEPMHTLPMFCAAPRADTSTAESIQRRLVNLPSSPRLGMD